MGKTFDIAAESLTGNDLARKISKALGRPVTYARFPAELLAQQPVLARLVELVDEGAA
ncbi:MAG: NmrA family protein, partial [Myxococcaceae bacterium]|nr:NmrA family protein [Myxococcaceae bacterium]